MYFGVEELICEEIKLLRLRRVSFNALSTVLSKMAYSITRASHTLFLFLKLLENNRTVDDEVGTL